MPNNSDTDWRKVGMVCCEEARNVADNIKEWEHYLREGILTSWDNENLIRGCSAGLPEKTGNKKFDFLHFLLKLLEEKILIICQKSLS